MGWNTSREEEFFVHEGGNIFRRLVPLYLQEQLCPKCDGVMGKTLLLEELSRLPMDFKDRPQFDLPEELIEQLEAHHEKACTHVPSGAESA